MTTRAPSLPAAGPDAAALHDSALSFALDAVLEQPPSAVELALVETLAQAVADRRLAAAGGAATESDDRTGLAAPPSTGGR